MKTKFHSYNIKTLGVSAFFLPISHYVDLHWQKRNNSPLKCWHLMFLVTLFRKANFWGVKSKCICISWRTESKICGRHLAFHGAKYSASKLPCHHYLRQLQVNCSPYWWSLNNNIQSFMNTSGRDTDRFLVLSVRFPFAHMQALTHNTELRNPLYESMMAQNHLWLVSSFQMQNNLEWDT